MNAAQVTHTPGPAALASIKRYSIVAYECEDGPHWEYREHPAGEFYFVDQVAKLFATLPPVTDEMVERACRAYDKAVLPGWGYSDKDYMRAALIAVGART